MGATTPTWSCRSGPPRSGGRATGNPAAPSHVLTSVSLDGFRGYVTLAATFGPGAQLVWGPNAAGKTSLLEALVVCARGASHRTLADAELIRWDAPFARIEGGRKRIRVNGVPRRVAALAGLLRVVVFAPEEMLLIVGSPALRRGMLDALAAQRSPAHPADLAVYARVLAQRNALLRAIREGGAGRDQLPPWDAKLVDSGAAVIVARQRALHELADPLAAAHAEIAADEGPLPLR